MKSLIMVSIFFVLSGCSMTLPVEGSLGESNERFLGEATGYMSGEGTLVVRTANGLECDGKFKYSKSWASGNGNFNCSDGRTGEYIFTQSGNRGNGVGKLSDGEEIRFKFGSTSYIGQKEVMVIE
jgi:hypothetical protein